ncbi:TetR/AcrR family transcriptional regulator [Amycolatopsis albispora]|uniref:TetR family transcriptional regulator n=1 Tax=Amycolatopsis albispora TaxID=1804986 RepID=A0A344LG12_9PSEU|nr:TetR/AcrR family transcriptional regulator [Amycolatopsis albispora]AXB46986.1 TetR family transcriptional regulator [Amycolatopsis albispora]
MTVEHEETRLRADARRNRDQILGAAKELFADAGPDVPMEEIARRAGVGVGTLYRRFPDRASLLREVARDTFRGVLADARTAIDEEPTAWDALVRFLRITQRVKLSVQLAMLSPLARAVFSADPSTDEFRREALGILDRIVEQAQAEGSLRPDVGAGDVTIMFSLLLRELPHQPMRVSSFATDRCIALMLDGLRARPGSPLPGRAVTSADIFDA